jgi:hypothetical protein
MKLSTLTIILYGFYILCLVLTKDNLVAIVVRKLWLNGDYEHSEAATLLLLSPLVFYGIYRAANRLFYEFKEWWIDRRDSK